MSLQFGHLEKKKEHNYKFTFTFVYAPTGLVLVVAAAHVSRKTFKFIFAAAKKHYQTNTTKQIKQFIFINANKTKDCSPQAYRICVCLSVSTKL